MRMMMKSKTSTVKREMEPPSGWKEGALYAGPKQYAANRTREQDAELAYPPSPFKADTNGLSKKKSKSKK